MTVLIIVVMVMVMVSAIINMHSIVLASDNDFIMVVMTVRIAAQNAAQKSMCVRVSAVTAVSDGYIANLDQWVERIPPIACRVSLRVLDCFDLCSKFLACFGVIDARDEATLLSFRRWDLKESLRRSVVSRAWVMVLSVQTIVINVERSLSIGVKTVKRGYLLSTKKETKLKLTRFSSFFPFLSFLCFFPSALDVFAVPLEAPGAGITGGAASSSAADL